MTSKAGAIYVGERALSRRRKAPMRFDDRLFKGHFTKTKPMVQYGKHRYLHEGMNDSIQDRSDQPGHTILRILESLLMKACKK